jgi:nicotinamidase-related amidase
MAERIWDKFLTERDKQVFAAGGFGTTMEPGKRPVLLIIDVNYNFCGDRPEPILESIKRWHTSCGQDAWDALPHIRRLIDACRAKGLPVIYTTGLDRRADGWDAGAWAYKNKRTDEHLDRPAATNRDGNDIMDEIAPGPKDIVVHKEKPSAFFGTGLMGYLTKLGADSIIVTGTTTSGCVRGSVIDAFSYNYRLQVVEEGCFDRSQASHAINLADMNAKYADVVSIDKALAYIESLPDGVFAETLPSGRSARG